MRAVWSFWSKPFRAYKGRIWRDPLHHVLAWGLSLGLACKHYPESVLVTDTAGKSLLVDQLSLRFDHVSTELDRLRDADPGWWALGKLVAYSLQDRPFVHLDTDVFLWKPLPATLVNAPVFTQCPEQHPLDGWCGPRDVESVFARHGLSLPAEWEWSRSLSSNQFREESCGILGGTNVDFIRYYADLAIDLVANPKHAAAWAAFAEKAGYNMLIEQFLLAACLDFHRHHPNSPFRGIVARHLFPSFEVAYDPQAAARLGYTHLLGDAKSNALITRRLEQRVEQEDPAFYRHCLRLRKNPRFAFQGA
ncbi:MAG: DUF6734 family protein [Methylocella sp.]